MFTWNEYENFSIFNNLQHNGIYRAVNNEPALPLPGSESEREGVCNFGERADLQDCLRDLRNITSKRKGRYVLIHAQSKHESTLLADSLQISSEPYSVVFDINRIASTVNE